MKKRTTPQQRQGRLKDMDLSPLIDKEPEIQRNLRWTILHTLATRPHIQPLIQQMYESNRILYFQAYKNSLYGKEHPELAYFTTETKELLIQTAGILAWAEQQSDYTEVFSLIQKGFKYTWNFIKQHHRFEAIEFIHGFMKGSKDALEASQFSVLGIFVCRVKNLPIELDGRKAMELTADVASFVVSQIFDYMQETYELFIWEPPILNEVLAKAHEGDIQALEQKWRVKKGVQLSFFQLLTKIRDEEGEQFLKERNLFSVVKEIAQQQHELRDELTSMIVRTGETRAISALIPFLDAIGIETIDLLNHFPVHYDEAKKLLAYVQGYVLDERIQPEERDMAVSALWLISALAHEYRTTKEKYFSLHVEELEYQFQEKEKRWKEQLQERQSVLAQKEAELKKEQAEKEKELSFAMEEAEKWRKQATLLGNELEKAKQPQKELDALKAYLEQQEEGHEPTVSMEDMMKLLNEKNIVMIGGHPKWQQKMKEWFPHFRFVDTDEVNRDISFLDFTDLVCINTTFLSHTMYWKVMNRMNETAISLTYINESSNRERAVQHLYETFMKKSQSIL